ncbi:hypothetical protein AGDE_05303 [Angomonas deanei]|nr:hypothetical protein AGDE_05303 [Angomonas deanei]|eukprot:EPY38626.1 hypothetical protein AGDE_05303 [Angomonas deanei]
MKATILSLFLLSCLVLASATDYIVVDVDGSVEGYAALTTLLRATGGSQLKMVSVSGTTWGFSTTVVRNVCRFLNLAGKGNVEIALGASASMDDAYNTSTKHGECFNVAGFPLTPQDAARRELPFSRADVSSAFSAANSLPHTATTVNCGYTTDAKTSLVKILRRVTTADKFIYLSLGSTVTNLATVVKSIQQEGDVKTLMDTLTNRSSIHVYEPGYAGAADPTAMTTLLSYNLPIDLYPSVFFSPATQFTESYWTRFTTIASTVSASSSLQWVHEAWTNKKEVMGDTLFYNDCAPAASLVTLCAVDSVLTPLCKYYRATVSSVSFQLTKPSATSGVLTLDGQKVTPASYYTLVTNASPAVVRVYTKSATGEEGGRTLKDAFWSRWFELLQ